jgi:predicted nucleotidyltransferase
MVAQHTMLDRDEALRLLTGCKREMQTRYGITAIGLFGSFARNQATEDSDVDIVVQLSEPDLFTLVHIKDELEDALHRRVDILQYREKMNPYLKRQIEQEAVYV